MSSPRYYLFPLLAFVHFSATADKYQFAELPQIITPGKLPLPQNEIPYASSVIYGEDLVKLGIKTIPDIFRLVPGFSVGQGLYHDYSVEYHGNKLPHADRMNVLLDGLSVYKQGANRVDWLALPVSIQDIARIEIVRSPSADIYGANGFAGSVNIITKTPSPFNSNEATIRYSSHDFHQARAALSHQVGDSSFLLTLFSEKERGFTSQVYPNMPEAYDPGDGYHKKGFRLQATGQLAEDVEIETRISYVDFDSDRSFVSFYDIREPEKYQEDTIVQTKLIWDASSSNTLVASLNFVSTNYEEEFEFLLPGYTLNPELGELYKVNPALAGELLSSQTATTARNSNELGLFMNAVQSIMAMGPSSLLLTTGVTDTDYQDQATSGEVHLNTVWDDTLSTNIGFGARNTSFDSPTLTGGTVDTDYYYAWINGVKHFGDLVVNTSVFKESTPLIPSDPTSWRLGLNYQATDNLTFRASQVRAKKIPGVLYTERNWQYVGRDLIWGITDPATLGNSSIFGPDQSGSNLPTTSPFYISSISDPNDSPDTAENDSKEVGIFYRHPKLGMTLDVKFFKETLKGVSSNPLDSAVPVDPNNGWIKSEGAEIEVTTTLTQNLSLKAGLSYRDMDASPMSEYALYHRWGHYGTVIYDLNDYAIGFYIAGHTEQGRAEEDLRTGLTGSYRIADGMWLRITYTYLFNNVLGNPTANGSAIYSRVGSASELVGEISYSF